MPTRPMPLSLESKVSLACLRTMTITIFYNAMDANPPLELPPAKLKRAEPFMRQHPRGEYHGQADGLRHM